VGVESEFSDRLWLELSLAVQQLHEIHESYYRVLQSIFIEEK
jgi:hypothetical protein